MTHDDRTGEETDDSRKPDQLPKKVCEVTIHKNEARLLDGVLVERFVYFEKVAQTESCEDSESHTEEEKVAEIEGHLPNHFETKYFYYLRELSTSFIQFQVWYRPEQDDGHCIVNDSFPEKNRIQDREFLGLNFTIFLP